MQKQYDFISIGDMTTDAFIRLKDASVHCDVDKEKCEICMKFADKIPYDEVYVIPAVGNNANAAVSAARLGLTSAIVSNLGKDRNGEDALAALAGEGVSGEFIKVHRDVPTNYHYVLWYEDDRTILIKHQQYDYDLPNIDSPRWAYLSSMGEHSREFHDRIADYLDAREDIKLAFQPGTFQMKLGIEALQRLYRRAEVFVCNKEEYQRILKTDAHEPTALMNAMRDNGPRITVLTDGPNGAYASDASSAWFMPIYPDPKPPLERTGAGDAFSSTFVVALALGLSLEDALRWAPVNAMSVVQHVGAREGLLTRDRLEEYLAEAPPDYAPRRI
jgi:sugar/nucleoside kinase (ribokinase family)